ncbi:hypothetical protein E4U54_001677 [Claviceps lovelessii]|nr:hypothetical protein E4U54_001677 [Claviceps lovelessii]
MPLYTDSELSLAADLGGRSGSRRAKRGTFQSFSTSASALVTQTRRSRGYSGASEATSTDEAIAGRNWTELDGIELN